MKMKGLIEMTNRRSAMEEVNLIAKMADLQETDYQNTVLLHAMIELFIQKGIFTKDELLHQAQTIDKQLGRQIQPFDLYTITQKELPRKDGHASSTGLSDPQAAAVEPTITPPIS